MNFVQRLCALTLLMFGCISHMNAVDTETIKALGEKIKTGKKITPHEFKTIKTLKEEFPDIISDEALELLNQHGRIPNARIDLRSSKSSERIDRKNVADHFLTYSNES